jgi:Ca-activated chloride channel homolog
LSEDLASIGLCDRRHSSIRPVLLDVNVAAELDGLMLSVHATQRYRYDPEPGGDEAIELVYRAPLPSQAELLGLALTVGGRRLQGVVTDATTAYDHFEHGMQAGDLPVLVDWRDGIATAQLGNLKPREEVLVELHYVQIIRPEQGQLRLALPMTLAPRYGGARLPRAGEVHAELPEASLLVEHGLTLTLDVRGDLARGSVECPTHAHVVRRGAGTEDADPAILRLELSGRAWLDRDVVVTLRPAERSAGCGGGLCGAAIDTSADPPEIVVSAVFEPVWPDAGPEGSAASALPPLADLKLLVDCSSSMAGDGIALAREAVVAVLDRVRRHDPDRPVNLTRFGSVVTPMGESALPLSPERFESLRAAAHQLQADLGGTELERALRCVSTVASLMDGRRGDVLLITDGQVQRLSDAVDSVNAARHRVFAIGVGSAPVEGLLRELAEATGGACEFVSAGQSAAGAALRLLERMRQPIVTDLRVLAEAGGQCVSPVWTTPLPWVVFKSVGLVVHAGFGRRLDSAASDRLPVDVTLCGKVDGEEQVLARLSVPLPPRPSAPQRPADDVTAASRVPPTLVRMAAAARLRGPGVPDIQVRQALALRCQVVIDSTRLVVVHERAEADRVTAFAGLRDEPVMLAAGWGGTSQKFGTYMKLNRWSTNPIVRSGPAALYARKVRDDVDNRLDMHSLGTTPVALDPSAQWPESVGSFASPPAPPLPPAPMDLVDLLAGVPRQPLSLAELIQAAVRAIEAEHGRWGLGPEADGASSPVPVPAGSHWFDLLERCAGHGLLNGWLRTRIEQLEREPAWLAEPARVRWALLLGRWLDRYFAGRYRDVRVFLKDHDSPASTTARARVVAAFP